MRYRRYIIYLILLFSLSSCTGRSSSSSYDSTKNKYTYVDGDYYAGVKYYNPKTGTHSTYTLKVNIKEDKLVTLYFTNGGWLDDSHFTPPDISSGTAKFKTDRNYRYEVTMLERVEDESYQGQDDNKCPKCGYHKYSWDELCDDCQKEENDEICPNCGNDKYSWDESCEDCQEDEY